MLFLYPLTAPEDGRHGHVPRGRAALGRRHLAPPPRRRRQARDRRGCSSARSRASCSAPASRSGCPSGRCGSSFGFVLVLSGIKLVGLPAATTSSRIGRRARRGRDPAGLCGRYGTGACSPRGGVEWVGPWPGYSRPPSVVGLLAATAVAFALTEGAKTELQPDLADLRDEGVLAEGGPAGVSHRDRAVQAAQDASASRFGSRTRRTAAGAHVAADAHGARRVADRARLTGFADDGVDRPRRRLLAGDEARDVAPDDCAAEPDPHRHCPAEDRGPAPAPPDHLAGRRSSWRPLPGRVPHERARTRRARGRLRARTHVVEFTRSQKTTGNFQWNGKVAGKALKPGLYVLLAAAQDEAGNRSKPTPVRSRDDPLRLAFAQGDPRRARQDLCATRLDRRAVGAMAASRPLGHGETRHPSSPRAEGRRHLHAVRHRRNAYRTLHCGRQVSAEAARIAGVIGGARARAADRRAAARLAHRRARRLGGRLRAARRLPRPARTSPCPGGRRGGRHRRRSGRSPGSSLRVPWLLAVAVLACVPARIPVHGRLDEGELAAAPLRGRRRAGDRTWRGSCTAKTRACVSWARLAWPVALFVAWTGSRCSGRSDCAPGGDRTALLRPAAWAARRLPRSPRCGRARWVQGALRPARAMALVFAADRHRTSTGAATSSGTQR